MKTLPSKFDAFRGVLASLDSSMPTGIALVGSYGDRGKTPDVHSDLDIVFVFDTDAIGRIVQEFLNACSEVQDLVATYLGVHCQFGHVVNLYFRNDALHWVDVGVMDRWFSERYLVDLPMTVVRGHVATCGIPTFPRNQLGFLARKLRKAQRRNDPVYVADCACRYVAWLHVAKATELRERASASRDPAGALSEKARVPRFLDAEPRELLSNDLQKIVDAVFEDVARRFPEFEACEGKSGELSTLRKRDACP